MTLVDPTGRILTEIRDDATVAAITTRIRGGEPAPPTYDPITKALIEPGDSRGAGKYVPFVVLTRLGGSRLKRCPIQEVRLLAKCYATTAPNAAILAGAVSDAIHAKGHRISGAGVAIFGSFDDGGQGATRDPDTQQWHEDLVIQVNASTSLLNV